MDKLTRDDLYSLEKYAEVRSQFRADVMKHKLERKAPVGPNVTLHFEDRLTMQYQIQEMLRVERIYESAGIEEELESYNPLIPDGSNFKATMMVEYNDVDERKQALARLIGIEGKTWVQVSGHDKVYAIADEDMERDTEEKTSSVHFMRFELSPEMVAAAKSGTAISVGVDHENYSHQLEPLPQGIRDSLARDLA